MPTKIEYVQESWNPIVGCSHISPGCDHCFAERMANRLASMDSVNCLASTVRSKFLKYCTVINSEGKWNGETNLHLPDLMKPLKWKKPRMIFVVSMGDLFHESVPFEWIDRVFDAMAEADQHTYLLLTKRPERMKEFFESYLERLNMHNVWIGVTAENQEMADKRIPLLLQIPAAKRFVSIEPQLSGIDLVKWMKCNKLEAKNNCHETQRIDVFEPNSHRSLQDRRRGKYLEDEKNDGREQDGLSIDFIQSQSAKKSGEVDFAQSSEGYVHNQHQEICDLRPQSGMDLPESTNNPGWNGDKPQGWQSKEQQSEQFGGGDKDGKYDSCRKDIKSNGEKETERRDEQFVKIDQCSYSCDKGNMEQSTNVSSVNSKTFQCISDNNKRDLPEKNMEAYIDWVITGGETGPGARPMNPDWINSIRDQCQKADVPFFFKSWGDWYPDSHVSFNGPFFIYGPGIKHRLIDQAGNSWPYAESPVFDKRYTLQEYEESLKCRLTKEDNAWWMARVGKKVAGHLIEGKEWREMP